MRNLVYKATLFRLIEIFDTIHPKVYFGYQKWPSKMPIF